ncbi:hypothetical protein JHD50_00900 [Sulfurimonas sp. MAG313]|nr:hypothetical protein [Sulfurimonas sp. MAG313]MDF1879869.1 hypothetical protein [Sulfurimonas sp. MAG313]
MAGFIHEDTPRKNPIVPSDFRHSLCVGSTGCGKISSFILPNMAKRMQKNYGMFILLRH